MKQKNKMQSVAATIHHLKLAVEFSDDVKRQFAGQVGGKMFSEYSRRINWILTDLKTNIEFPDIVRAGIKQEIDSDLLSIPSIVNRIHELSPMERETVEEIIELLADGNKLKIEVI